MADLDPVHFSDETFPSYVSLNQAGGYAEDNSKQNKPRLTRNAEVITDVLYYADAETNTRHKKKDAEVLIMIS